MSPEKGHRIFLLISNDFMISCQKTCSGVFLTSHSTKSSNVVDVYVMLLKTCFRRSIIVTISLINNLAICLH